MIRHRAPFKLVRWILMLVLAGHGLLMAVPVKFLPWDGEVGARKIGLQSGKNVIELTGLHPHKRSKAYNAVAGEDGSFQLVAIDKTDAAGKPASVVFKIPADNATPLVLLLPDPSQPAGFKPFVIEDSPDRFPWGSVRIFNATKSELLIRHETKVAELKVWAPTDVAPGGDARNISVQIVARDKRDVLLYSAIWEHDPNFRKLVFIVPSGDDGSELDLKIIPEDRRIAVLEEQEKPH